MVTRPIFDEESHGAIPENPFSHHYHIWKPNITYAIDMPWGAIHSYMTIFTALEGDAEVGVTRDLFS